jgi:hypothetical protein
MENCLQCGPGRFPSGSWHLNEVLLGICHKPVGPGHEGSEEQADAGTYMRSCWEWVRNQWALVPT